MDRSGYRKEVHREEGRWGAEEGVGEGEGLININNINTTLDK